MDEHRQQMEAETNANKRSQMAKKIDNWEKALTEVANLKGNDVNGRLETEFIDEVVKDIYLRLRVPLRSALPQLIGRETSKNFVTSWLKDTSSDTRDILTIFGMGGIGKTSLTKYVYGLHCHEFDTSSYIEDMSRRCAGNFNGLLDLQKQLCSDISKTSPIQGYDFITYTSHIENLVADKKVLLVLDDIDSLDQLNALLGSKAFHRGSKIMITTKNVWLTESCLLFKTNPKPKHEKYELKCLWETESRKLLCVHAFMCNDPEVGYEEVLEKLVKYCEGHPFALEVLGKSLHNRDVAYWEECIEGLKRENSSPVNNVLRISFDSLSSKNDKDLFKHIACFFVGTDKDVTETILKACNIKTRSGITNLIDRCLLSIGRNNKLMMHGLLQEMGRFVVREESPDKPWKRSRLWCHEESFKVLKQEKGKGKLLGLSLDMRMLEKEKLGASFELKTDALGKLNNLMLLQLNYVQINGSYTNFPKELRWLCMHGFPLKSLPSDLPTENLVALDMSYSNIESFGICYGDPQRLMSRKKLTGSCLKNKRLLGSLKILNLSFCEELCCLGCFANMPSLERLIVRNCIGLVEVCESIEACVKLVLVDLSYCNKLEKLPRIISMLKKVKTLVLDGCNLGGSQIKITDLEKLTAKIDIDKKPSSSAILEAITNDFKFFSISLPSSLVSVSLKNNNLSMKSFPIDFSCLSMLKNLYLDGNPFISMPNCLRSLPRLEMLSMGHCKRLASVEHPPQTLRKLILFSTFKPLLRKVVFHPEMSPLDLIIPWKLLAPSSLEIQGIVKIQPIEGVEEKVLRSLGWSKLDFLSKRRTGTYTRYRGTEESKIQMYYQFGIFSTIYGGKEMPNWITDRSKGPSISFTILSCQPNNLRGLEFCCLQAFIFPNHQFHYPPLIVITNVTKNRTWIYEHCIDNVIVDEECVILLSHWMFGKNEMEGGDHVTIRTVTGRPYNQNRQITVECGVRLVYEEEEEDALCYYKSWNHIIGGDLTGYQLTTGEYILSITGIKMHGVEENAYYRELLEDGSHYKGKTQFRALSPKEV
ncbi:disease resistance protein RUN1 isoform X1 [Lactuca sativa]|uniref:disease resistance protein RUN1 isoform X1 n=1 Tax=Lactuca sativa TaxID=4236 RepID=UPI000CD9B786|nr:disease resistance protein RUN1 isoform X1 [Lactuca sativa]